MKSIFCNLLVMTMILSCSSENDKTLFDVKEALKYCNEQVERTLFEIRDTPMMPRNIMDSLNHWKLVPVSIGEWTIGFWPGILWYNYENTESESMKNHAIYYTELLEPLTVLPAYDHDLGFQIFCSYGNAYRLTGNEKYKQIVINAADTLATLFHPLVGTMLSWPREVKNGYGPTIPLLTT